MATRSGPRVLQGTNPNRAPVKMTDEDIIKARRLYEGGGYSIAELATNFEVSTNYMSSIVNYMIRSKLFIEN